MSAIPAWRISSGLTKMEVLDLCNTKITDAWRDAMPDLPRLGWLDLRGTKVTDAGLNRLLSLPSLKSLFLSGPKITNMGLEQIAKISRWKISACRCAVEFPTRACSCDRCTG